MCDYKKVLTVFSFHINSRDNALPTVSREINKQLVLSAGLIKPHYIVKSKNYILLLFASMKF
jgi:hypothetical protein